MNVMIRKIILSALFIIPLFAVSQNFNGGILAGMSASQISGDGLSGYDKPGIYGGGFVRYDFTDRTAFQMEMTYIDRGSKKNARPDKGDPTAYTLSLKYVDLSLLYKYMNEINIKQEESTWSKGIDFVAGPYMGVLISDKEKDENGEFPFDPNVPEFDRIDIGGLAGFSFWFNDHLAFNWRIALSLIPIREHRGGGSFRLNHGQHNNTMTFAFQYTF